MLWGAMLLPLVPSVIMAMPVAGILTALTRPLFRAGRESLERKAACMADPGIEPNAGRFAVRVTVDSHFAWLRTRASVERTLMSWIRTAVSLIGFGFTIVEFFRRMEELPGTQPRPSSGSAAMHWACIDCLRHPGACYFDLAVPVDSSLPAKRKFRRNRRTEGGGNADTDHRGGSPPHRHWRVRLSRRSAASRVAAQVGACRPRTRSEVTSSIKGDRNGQNR